MVNSDNGGDNGPYKGNFSLSTIAGSAIPPPESTIGVASSPTPDPTLEATNSPTPTLALDQTAGHVAMNLLFYE
ncbi:UNVERIFIED_CONTAM: hypothetical protein Slati_1717200 [Sesamum latifolium]|uniref:Uncharacterized protein n=1 Tax=Sesamum latifolium TaxID=2727402 RepID=A0AAW2WWS3_9LAMI